MHFSPTLNVNGADRSAIRSEVLGSMERFADMVVDEILGGAEESGGELMR